MAVPTIVGKARFIIATPDGRYFFGMIDRSEIRIYSNGPRPLAAIGNVTDNLIPDFIEHEIMISTTSLQQSPDVYEAAAYITEMLEGESDTGNTGSFTADAVIVNPNEKEKPPTDEWDQIEP